MISYADAADTRYDTRTRHALLRYYFIFSPFANSCNIYALADAAADLLLAYITSLRAAYGRHFDIAEEFSSDLLIRFIPQYRLSRSRIGFRRALLVWRWLALLLRHFE